MLAILVFLSAELLCWPFGDYPLNDDWQFARTAKNFAQTGKIVIDTPVAPSLVGQSLLAAPIIKIFGFSHVLLRLLTLSLSALCLWTMDRLLALASVRPWIRLATLLTVAFNPLYFYLSATFMTEIYGYVTALVGVVLWFQHRQRREAQPNPGSSAVSLRVSIGVGALIGWSFWTRQYCAMLYPALVGATALHLWSHGGRSELRTSLRPFLAGLGVWFAMIVLYLGWTRLTNNYRPEFAVPFSNLMVPDLKAWRLQLPVFVIYLGVFLAPLSLLAPWRKSEWRALAVTAAALLLLVHFCRLDMLENGAPDFVMRGWFRKTFPYLHNIIYNAGLGPITFPVAHPSDVDAIPRWPADRWKALEKILLLLPVCLAPLLVATRRFWRDRREHLAPEVFLFGALTAAFSLAVTIQAYRMHVFDRYHFPGLLGLALSAAVLLQYVLEPAQVSVRVKRLDGSALLRSASAGLVGAALALFSIAGMHDYFRWNDARWQLVNGAIAGGASALNIQAGYEVDGWLLLDAKRAGQQPPSCSGGQCRCRGGWYCIDDSLRVGMGPLRGYRVVKSIQPDYWLAAGPPVQLSQR